jgi:PAS domain S-box-containing protein
LQGSLDHLIGRIVEVLPVTSAGITLISPGHPPRYIAASDDAALRYEKLQTDLREGPCLLAYDSGDAVAIPDVRLDERFPLFCPAALEDGLGAVFAFPLRHGDGRLGALDVYLDSPGTFDYEDMAAAQSLADVVAACLTVRSGPMSSTDDADLLRLGVLDGVTERRATNEALRRSEELHRSAMETMTEGAYVLSADGRVLGSNATARRLLGVAAGDFAELLFVQENGSELPANEYPTSIALREGTFAEAIVGVLDARGGRRWLAASSQPLRRTESGRPWAAVCTISDITAQREAARLSEESVGVFSHEMRTPLTSIKGALDMIAAGATGELTDPAQRMIDVASNNTERLLRLVDSMLDLAKVDSGRTGLNFADADLTDLVRQAVAVMGPLADCANVQIVMAGLEHLGPTLNVDSDRIIQTLTNLLSNAVKFSPEGGVIDVSIDPSSGDEPVVVRVIDHGRGVPPEMFEEVFERFRQVAASDARSGTGTGLGLAICRSIIEGHRGKIWIEATPGGGTTCIFTLPQLVTP